MKWLLTGCLMFSIAGTMWSQSRSRIIPPDGLYLQPASLASQTPEFDWEAIDSEWYIGEEDHYLRGKFQQKDTGLLIRPLVVCVENGCFLLDPVRTDTLIQYYAPLIECGAICIYRIERQYPIQVPIRAYNPVNGKPFLESTVERSKSSEKLMMWRPETNEHALLTSANYAAWTGADDWPSMRESELIKGIRTYNLIFVHEGKPQNQD